MGFIIAGKKNFALVISADRLIDNVIGADKFFQIPAGWIGPNESQEVLKGLHQVGGVKSILAKLIKAVGGYLFKVGHAL